MTRLGGLPSGHPVDMSLTSYRPIAWATFENFGTTHLAMLTLCVAAIPVVIAAGRRLRGTAREQLAARLLAVAICCFTIPMQAIDLLPENFDLQTTLPLQLCDFAWLAVVWALWTRSPLPVALSYYWGLVLTPQAILTPWLNADWPDPKYIGFWGMHLLIVWGAVFVAWGLGERPGWTGFRRAVAVTFTWMVLVFGFNSIAGTNYGFVNHKPSDPSVLDYLGPWPLYLVAEIAIVATVWALMTLPQVRRGRDQTD